MFPNHAIFALAHQTSKFAHWLLFFFTLLVSACQPALPAPPRLATATAQAQATITATPAPLLLPAPTATGTSGATDPNTAVTAVPNPSLTIWINETSPAHKQALESMAAQFSQEHEIDVELMLIAPMRLPTLMETAVLSDTLPDMVLHPVEYTIGWTERGILDAVAADEIIDEIGRDTFDPAALALAQYEGTTAAIPSDGYQQLLIYRRDWFTELDLAEPDTYEAMLTAAETISDTAPMVFGFVIPTESNLTTTTQAFEHIATANGCQLIDEKGEVLLLEQACRQALNFYFRIVNRFSPPGVQTDSSALTAYLAGRTGMIMASPAVLPKLAGLDGDTQPRCPECVAGTNGRNDYLAQNSGIITHISGSSAQATEANFSELTYLGITRVADKEAAATFAAFWFNEGYETWLAIESERKVPMRLGTAATPRQFIDAWGTQPLTGGSQSLSDIYGTTTVAQLSRDVANSTRWGFPQGQGALITNLYEELTFSIVLQEMLSGYFGTEQTIIEVYQRVIDLIPNYQYHRDLEPTATPES